MLFFKGTNTFKANHGLIKFLVSSPDKRKIIDRYAKFTSGVMTTENDERIGGAKETLTDEKLIDITNVVKIALTCIKKL